MFAAFFNAEMRSGIEMVLDLAGFDDELRDADLVITGEGRMDAQTLPVSPHEAMQRETASRNLRSTASQIIQLIKAFTCK